ncbi:oligopeptide transport system ATP-binding protein [Izhakiella capsodis]|uniref:Oligopeptide transport system ATP-binding protein n=1 Tax=Izhakiella capsodis TaxID=1367852 RepID=A0A1I4Z7S6_9GAMM|nr:oligopeptide transport system ATP-binding protein [Izhakiella capsodis]
MILEPGLIICDEPLSALDVSIQAQVVNLLQKLQRDMRLLLIFNAYNLAVVKHFPIGYWRCIWDVRWNQ